MAGKILLEQVISAREYISLILHRGEILRVIDLEGKQVADLVALSAIDKDEKLSCIYSNLLNGTWKLTQSHTLYSNRAQPMFSIVEDKVGLHDSGGGFCSGEINFLRFKVRSTRNYADNLALAFKSHGVQREDFNFDCCLNIFMNLTFQPDGSMKLQEPLSKPGRLY